MARGGRAVATYTWGRISVLCRLFLVTRRKLTGFTALGAVMHSAYLENRTRVDIRNGNLVTQRAAIHTRAGLQVYANPILGCPGVSRHDVYQGVPI